MPAEPIQKQLDAAAIQSREEEVRRRHEEHVGAIVERIQAARQNVDVAVAQLQEASMELRAVCRRNFDEASSSYLVFANSHLRLAGALNQGVKRAASMDRILTIAAREREDAKARQEEFRRQQEVRAHARLVQKLQLPTDDDLVELYGEDMIDASV